jgi:hypothetical protein
MKPSSFSVRCTAIVATLLLFAGCASGPRREAQWIDPSIGAQSRLLRGEKVLIACDAYDAALRQICQDRLYRAVLAKGATPVIASPQTVLLNDRDLDSQLVAPADAAGAKAVFTVSLTPAATSAGSGASIGIGGFSFGGGGGVGVGLGLPLGGSRPETGYAASGRVTDVRNKRLVWTATVVTAPSSSLESQVNDLTGSMIDSAQDAGLF